MSGTLSDREKGFLMRLIAAAPLDGEIDEVGRGVLLAKVKHESLDDLLLALRTLFPAHSQKSLAKIAGCAREQVSRRLPKYRLSLIAAEGQR